MTPEQVVALLHARPWAAQPWAHDLVAAFPERLRGVLTHWGLELRQVHLAGAGLPVLEAERRPGPAGPQDRPEGRESPEGDAQAGRGVVVKFGGGGADVAQQARILDAADGHGYVRLLAYDPRHDALLLERLGPILPQTVPDPVAQTDVLGDLLLKAWEVPLAVGIPFTPQHKARSLLAIIDSALAADGLDSPLQAHNPADICADTHADVLARARTLALDLIESPSPHQVVVHGDPHPANVLQRGDSHVLIDPDGFLCEPEYDLGVALRDHQQVIEALDRTDGPGSGRRWHAALAERLAGRVGLDAERTLAWAHLERVTSGVYLSRLGYTEEGEAWLRTARRVLR
ncbi:aminoglycoside phosphotransferase family protein [Brachybacterium sp. FME24]|uniref:aminoglycoside phosphotransferase family protein n=1 Tax=Brachybacterium sp. FME24 TaxID=2742605 RepID=UPI001866351A|nr:aminoglycoside phosphotransferase family protein [Brachybacterium sp. FME24]